MRRVKYYMKRNGVLKNSADFFALPFNYNPKLHDWEVAISRREAIKFFGRKRVEFERDHCLNPI